MKISTVYIFLIAVIVVAIVSINLKTSDCVTPKKPPKGPEPERTWGPETNGCVMSIKAEKEEIPACERIIIKIYIKNVGETRLPIVERDIYRDITFNIEDEKGKVASLTSFGNKMMKPSTVITRGGFDLQSGDEVDYQKSINRIYDMTCLGEYKITAKRNILKRDEKGNLVKDENGYVEVEVVSNTITVKVTN